MIILGDSSARRKSHITFSRGRDDCANGRRISKASKRQSMWGVLPMSPLGMDTSSPASASTANNINGVNSNRRVSSIDKNNTSTDSLEDLQGLAISPQLKMSRLSSESNDKDSSGKVEKKRDSTEKKIPLELSPVINETSTSSKIVNSRTPVTSTQRTPSSANQKSRDSSGYYTANESIEDGQSISDESKEFIEFSIENTPTSFHCLSRRASSGSNASDMNHNNTMSSSRRGSINDESSTKIVQLKNSLESATAEIEKLRSELNSITKEKMILDVKIHSVEDQRNDFEARAKVLYEEVQSQTFLNSVLEQKNEELQCQISSDRLDRNEQIQSKTKKFKAEIERLKEEKRLYEDRADEMCKEMGEQMSLLQNTAMARIEVLENELLQERREKEEIEAKMRQSKQADLMKSLKGNATGRKSDSSDDTACTISTEERNEEDDDDDDNDIPTN